MYHFSSHSFLAVEPGQILVYHASLLGRLQRMMDILMNNMQAAQQMQRHFKLALVVGTKQLWPKYWQHLGGTWQQALQRLLQDCSSGTVLGQYLAVLLAQYWVSPAPILASILPSRWPVLDWASTWPT